MTTSLNLSKKRGESRTRKVILHPGFVGSKRDGDRHFISASTLAMLYGVRKTDTVKTYNGPMSVPSLEEQYEEGWINLEPRFDGDYYDIHDESLYPSSLKISL